MKRIRLVVGTLLLIAAVTVAFFWFYWLAPLRNLCSCEWLGEHSEQGKWLETQKQILRTGIGHDSSIDLGYFGDKAWTEWAVRKMAGLNGKDIGSCGDPPYHLFDALVRMTNRRVTNDLTWTAWWEMNKEKSQVDWIRDGFAQRGIVLHDPLTTNDIVTLLCVSEKFRDSSLVYNARRWLRDSGVDPRKVNLEQISMSEKDVVSRCLVDYAVWYGTHLQAPGSLVIIKQNGSGLGEAMINEPRVKICVIAIIIGTAVAGSFLLGWPWLRRGVGERVSSPTVN